MLRDVLSLLTHDLDDTPFLPGVRLSGLALQASGASFNALLGLHLFLVSK